MCVCVCKRAREGGGVGAGCVGVLCARALAYVYGCSGTRSRPTCVILPVHMFCICLHVLYAVYTNNNLVVDLKETLKRP